MEINFDTSNARGPLSLDRVMFNQANSFYEGALRCEQSDTHRLDRLYNALSKDDQKSIRRHYAAFAKVSRLKLKEHITLFSQVFFDWRYVYEASNQIRVDRLFYLSRSLYVRILETNPTWAIEPWLDNRIRSAPIFTTAIATGDGGLSYRAVLAP